MKIADIAEFYSEHGGGVRTYVAQKLAASARAGHETIVIAPGPQDREEHRPGGKVVWVKAPILPLDPRYHIFLGARGVHAVLAREQPDIIEGSSPWRGGWIAATAPTHAPRVLVMHADPVAVYPHTFLDGFIPRARIDRLFGWFWAYLRRLNAYFDATVVAGAWLERRLDGFGLRGLAVVPFGVERSVFSAAARDAAVHRAMQDACGLDADGKVLVAMGRHHPEKRLRTLIDAVARVNRIRPTGLFLMGDGPSRAAVERHAARVPHIHIAGQVGDRYQVARTLASADAFLHGSASETYGLAVAEALCCGAPLVLPDAGGAADFFDPAYAQSYRAGDAGDAARAIDVLLTRDRATLTQAAHTASLARIADSGAHFDKLFSLYEGLRRKR